MTELIWDGKYVDGKQSATLSASPSPFRIPNALWPRRMIYCDAGLQPHPCNY